MEFKPNLSLPLKPSYGLRSSGNKSPSIRSSDDSCDGSKQRQKPYDVSRQRANSDYGFALTNSHCDGSIANLVRGPKEADNTDDTASQRDSEQLDGSTD